MSGKRAAPRRAAPRSTSGGWRRVAAGVVGTAVTVVAWVYLVRAAIDFGATARGGQSSAWAFLALASLGAIACLFVALMLLTWVARALGVVRDPARGPRSKGGGRRAAR